MYCDPPADRAAGTTKLAGAVYPNSGMDPKAVWGLAWFSEKDIYQCLTDVKALRSSDGGETWSFNYTGHSLNTMYMAVKKAGNNTCYAATSSIHDMYGSRYLSDNMIDARKPVGRLLFSTDDGANWSVLHEWPMVLVFVATDPGKPNRLYASLANSKTGGIYMTDDLDKGPACTWTKLEAPPRTEGHPFNVVALKDGTIVCTYSGRRVGNNFTTSAGVFVSTDDGKTWQDRTDPGMQYWVKDILVDPADPAQNTWYVCVFHAWGRSAMSGKAGLYRTKDRGKTWTQLADNSVSPNKVLNVESCVINPDNPDEMYFTTEYDGLFCTTNLRSEKPVFKPVANYPFRHTIRAYFNPYKKGELWVTNNGYGVFVGQVR